MAAASLARVSLLAQTTRRAYARGPAPPLFVAAMRRRRLGSLSNVAREEAAVPRSVPVRVAYELQQAGHRYLDVRYNLTHRQLAFVRISGSGEEGEGMSMEIEGKLLSHFSNLFSTRAIPNSAGHPDGAVNVPYLYKTGSGMMKNTLFLEQVSGIFRKDDGIIVGCQSGKRSLMATTELCAAGFIAVTDIAGGFSSWTENGLPVNQ